MFDLFDRNKDETMNSRDLMAALKALGQNPSQEETRNLINQVIEICYWTRTGSHTKNALFNMVTINIFESYLERCRWHRDNRLSGVFIIDCKER